MLELLIHRKYLQNDWQHLNWITLNAKLEKWQLPIHCHLRPPRWRHSQLETHRWYWPEAILNLAGQKFPYFYANYLHENHKIFTAFTKPTKFGDLHALKAGKEAVCRIHGKNVGSIFSHLWSKVPKLLATCRGPAVIYNPIFQSSASCFFLKIFTIMRWRCQTRSYSAQCMESPFKVTQGHPLLCQSTRHIWLPISTQQ